MKVLLVAPYHPTKVGGIATWTKSMLDYCQGRKEIDLLFQNTSNNLPKRQSLKSKVTHILIGSIDSIWILIRLFVNLLTKHPDIVHYTSSAAFALYKDSIAVSLCHFFRVPIVVHWRFGRIPELCQQNNWEYRKLIKVMKMADASIVIDKSSYESLNGQPIKKIYCLPNPISQSLQKIAENIDVIQLQRKRNKREVTFVGHLLPTKGVSELVTAVANMPDVKKLNLIGPFFDDAYKTEILNIANSRDDGNWLNLTGELSRKDVWWYLQKCEIFCLPSYTEGFPNAVIEAMANGCTIVATTVGAIPEILGNDCGVTIPAKDVQAIIDAFMYIFNNEDSAMQMGFNARRKVLSEYIFDKVYQEYCKIWSTVIA